ncbi:hypothetical protein E2C01_074772 [Portunus trituberculatus]|uniref:Uncharacterized protein n=1 Tax=Portunus trituberculatus TaxID=210409 RepID=A0A5B7I6P7_PORTR|nr:hypothetical protein [Portunus trituberculatus]
MHRDISPSNHGGNDALLACSITTECPSRLSSPSQGPSIVCRRESAHHYHRFPGMCVEANCALLTMWPQIDQ